MSDPLGTSDWKHGQLQDLVFLQRGFDITQAQQTPGPYPVISSSGVTSYHSEFKAAGPGVVIGRKGTVGAVHFSESDYWPHDTTLWSKEFHGNNPRYVYFYLQMIDFKRFDVGNSNPTLNRNHIHDLPTLIPPRPIQDRIASVLSAYDQLIDNDARRMGLLEELAKHIFQEWFVRLRFPGYEHTSVSGGIPDGWERRALEHCVSVVETGNRPKGGVAGIAEGIPSIGAESIIGLGQFDFGKTKYVPEEYFARLRKGIISDRDVLVYKDGGKPGHFTPHVSMFGDGFPFEKMALNSHVYRVRGIDGVSQEFLYYHLSAEHTLRWMNKAGSGAAIPGLARKDLLRLPVLLPAEGLMRVFTNVITPIVTQVLALARHIRKLEEARDLLLPRLMNGKIAV